MLLESIDMRNMADILATRFPPIAVKLKGETAKTKPSRARYSVRLGRDEYSKSQTLRNRKDSLPASSSIFGWLNRVQLLNILHAKTQEIRKLLHAYLSA